MRGRIITLLCLVALVAPLTTAVNPSGRRHTISSILTRGQDKEPKSTTTSNSPRRGPNPPFGSTGYLIANATLDVNLFYWFVPAAVNADTAPLVLYLQGGPGCSMVMGLLYELGPYYVTPNLTLTPNKNGWNTKYNVLFIDNPVGTGFSYTTNPAGYVQSEAQATEDLYNALQQWFTTDFPQYAAHDFYIFGESYAGKWVPEIAYRILQGQQGRARASTDVVINLKGIGIGDGLSDPLIQAQSHATFAYATGLVDDVQRDQLQGMQQQVAQLIGEGKYTEAGTVWNNITLQIMLWSGMPDPSDVRYWGFSRLDFNAGMQYLNQPNIMTAIGTSGHSYKSACNQDVASRLTGDQMKSVKHLFPSLLENYQVLLYNGNFDFTVTPNGVSDWIPTIAWPGAATFKASRRWVWSVGQGTAAETAGFVRGGMGSNLTHVTVVQAGHMVPEDQPARTLDLVSQWISGTLQPPPPPPPPPPSSSSSSSSRNQRPSLD